MLAIAVLGLILVTAVGGPEWTVLLLVITATVLLAACL